MKRYMIKVCQAIRTDLEMETLHQKTVDFIKITNKTLTGKSARLLLARVY